MVKPLTEVEKFACNDKAYNINPHPDGEPWVKCCSSTDPNNLVRVFEDDYTCQCFMKKPQKGLSRFDSSKQPIGQSTFDGVAKLVEEKGRFFCVHRKDNGFHRECAGWAAKFGKDRMP